MTSKMPWFGLPLAFGLVLALALCARAADLATEVAQLAAAVDARLGNGATGKEAKKLNGLAKKLAQQASSTIDPLDLGKLVAAVHSSKTADSAVLDAAQDVIDCLRDSAVAQKAAADAVGAQLDDALRAKLAKKLDAAQARLDSADALVASDPKKATKLFRAAYVKFVKANLFAIKALARQQNLGNKIEIRATLSAPGDTRTFAESAFQFVSGSSVAIQGCNEAAKNAGGACRRVLNVGFVYAPGSRALGPVPGAGLSYSDSSDFQNGTGPGVQDLRWETFSFEIEVVASDDKRIKGRFSGTIGAVGPFTPETFDVQGTFVIAR